MGSKWPIYSLENICDGIFDCPHSTPELSSYGHYMVRTQDIRKGYFDTSDAVMVNSQVYKERTKRVTPKFGDLLFSREGTYFGDAAEVPENMSLCLGQRMVLIRPNPNIVSSKYLRIFINSEAFQRKLLAFRDGTVAERLNLPVIRQLPIEVPPMQIQKTIEKKYCCLEEKEHINRQINQTLEQMAQTLFKSWFVDFDPVIDNALDAGNDIPELLQARAELRQKVRASQDFQPLPADVRALFPAEFEESALGCVPKGWDYIAFGDLLLNSIGGDWGSDVPDEKHSVESRIVRGTDIPDLISGQQSAAPLRWVEPKKLATRKIESGDIIIEVSGGSPKQPTGRSIFMTKELIDRLGGVVEPASFCRRFQPKSMELGLLASLHLQKIYAEGKTWEYQNQSTGISNFQTKFFLEAELVMVPTNDVLSSFHDLTMPWITKTHSSEQILLAQLRDTLLPKLISGELRLDEIPSP